MPEILRELKLPMCLASNVAAASDIAQQGGMRKRGVKEERPAIAHVLPSLKAVLPTTHRHWECTCCELCAPSDATPIRV